MSESYILHDVMRKVKADGLFDSIRRDLISDIEQNSSYLDLKSQIESLMSSYLAEHKWSSSLKKSDIRERARRHIETSNLIKDALPSLVNQCMQTCQQQLVQPRLSSFVSDHIEHVYNSIGGTHIFRPSTSYAQSTTISQEPSNQEKPSQSNNEKKVPKKPNPTPKPSNPIAKKVPSSSVPNKPTKPLLNPTNSVREEKKPRAVSPLHSPNELIDISPSPPSIDNESTIVSLSPSPPPPVVRIASPLTVSKNKETPRKKKHSQERHGESSTNNIKKKKIKTDDKSPANDKSDDTKSIPTPKEKSTRKLRARRPNPKYSAEQFETGFSDIEIIEPSSLPPLSSSSTMSKPKRSRSLKSSTSFEQEQLDTPSSPCATSALNETATSVGDISPEYETLVPSPVMEQQPPAPQQQSEKIDERSRTPSPTIVNKKKSASPRRLRPRKQNERSSTVDNQNEKTTTTTDVSTRASTKTRESSRQKTEQASQPSSHDDTDVQPATKKSRLTSSSSTTSDVSSKDAPNRSISVPENLNAATDETQPTRVSPSALGAPVSKSFIWKPKISK
ncbi:unnamed protein product [Rotaria magnacalcarata]|uniref:BOD1/SHG1 domain-containing protein n=4 Tax=Rotaria magnacalcarata TaxID=392030 RepID=A0A814T6J2_9BILA|nr:unnamed protein product [Rotaria magnacalcarata]CAF1680371.1 unnamed protein product [Rotaria magnacalcarata]CAF2237708.1 unnamed protein product [Rotaria magnacalcarata]